MRNLCKNEIKIKKLTAPRFTASPAASAAPFTAHFGRHHSAEEVPRRRRVIKFSGGKLCGRRHDALEFVVVPGRPSFNNLIYSHDDDY